jgi:hypothetical protein
MLKCGVFNASVLLVFYVFACAAISISRLLVMSLLFPVLPVLLEFSFKRTM